MQLQELNSGLIFTNSNCIGCNKCISGCIAIGANVVVKDSDLDNYMVKVDPNRCILCGHCIKECVHDARTYRDDTDSFFDALARGEKISVMVAPSLLTNFEMQYNNILGYLKHLGVNHIYNVSFGADLMSWVYINFINYFGLAGVISQSCPVIVSYLEKYKPELLNYLMPVQSPVMCTAIYISDYLKITDKIAFISPCIAKKHEIDDVNTYGKVTFNVTFDRLMERIGGIDLSGYHAEDEVEYGLGSIVPTAGGLSRNIELYVGGDNVLIQTSGYQNIFPYFDHYYQDVSHQAELPFLVDAMNCTNGCCFGTATNCGVELRNKMSFSAHRSKVKAYKTGNVPNASDFEIRRELLNERFKDFELSSFVRQYDLTRGVSMEVVSEEEYEIIYRSMYKVEEKHRHTDCGACGYKTCSDMAYAIGTNVNHKENCINYSKECIRRETEKTNRLLSEIYDMNEELKESAQMKSNFLANMSHEIRTPMNAVIGMAEMALRGDLPPEEREYIQQIKSSGRSLLAIINDILDFSKIESGKMEINETDYTAMSIINDTVNIIMTRIGEKDITLVVDADPNIPYKMYGDDIRIKQVLVNFANNAIKFTESGCVELSMQYERLEEGVFLIVSIRDTGIGIKEKDLDSIFTSFQQLDSKRNRNIEGTGLGLAIAKEFVNLMGGEIHVKSKYGKGSTFSFRIPQVIIDDVPSITLKEDRLITTASLIQNSYVLEGYLKGISGFHIQNRECKDIEEIKEAVNSGAEFVFVNYPLWSKELDSLAQTWQNTQMVLIVDPKKDVVSNASIRRIHQPVYSLNIASVLNNEEFVTYEGNENTGHIRFEAPEAKVLIVDDNAINLTVALGLLSPLKMKMKTAAGAREAIEMIQEDHYDIIFMDHMMPDIDGVEATKMIREMEGEYYQSLPIIALTANAINNARDMFLREGMNDFVAKPIEMVDITAKLRKWLPPEKIKSLVRADDQQTKVSDEILEIEGIDVDAGLALSGSMELYLTILSDYYAVIEKKAELISQYEEEGSIEAYTIEVHALKSASKLIGATKLSEMAARMEKYGQDRDLGAIRDGTEELVAHYRAYIPILAPFGAAEVEYEENEMDVTLLSEKLTTLFEALDDFDIDTAGSVLKELMGCSLGTVEADFRQRLDQSIKEMEYDDAADIVKEWQTCLESYR